MKTRKSQTLPPETSAKSRRLKRSRFWLPILLLILASGGIVVWRAFTTVSNPPAPTAPTEPPPRSVATVAILQGKGVRRIRLLGQVEASKTATIRTQTTGTVERVFVEVGDRVTPGITIVTLNDADQRLALAEARAQLAQERSELARLEVGTRQEIIAQRRAELRSAQAREREAQENLERYEDLVAAGAISQKALLEERAAVDAMRAERLKAAAALAEAIAGPTQEEIDAQRARVTAAEAAVALAQLNLDRTRVKASAVGIVRSREVSTGDLVNNGDPLLTLVNSNDLNVFLELPEKLSGNVTLGLPVELTARALPNWREHATINGLVPAANAASRRQMVRVALKNPPQDLLPKMAVVGELQLLVAPSSLIVPRDALIRRDEMWLVYTVANGKANEVEVNLVADMGDKMAISSNELRVGQSVVVRGGEALADGTTVHVTQQN